MPMLTLGLRVVLAGAGVTVAVAAARPATPPARDPISIPFTFATKQPIVPVQVNGGPAVPFVVDTGASIHLIDREIARQAAVGDGRAVPLTGGGQATIQTQFVDSVALAAGGQAWGRHRRKHVHRPEPAVRGEARAGRGDARCVGVRPAGGARRHGAVPLRHRPACEPRRHRVRAAVARAVAGADGLELAERA